MNLRESIIMLLLSTLIFINAHKFTGLTKKWYKLIKFDYFTEKQIFIITRIFILPVGLASLYYFLKNITVIP